MDIAGREVLVFGLGISGIGAGTLLEKRGARVVLYDGNDKLSRGQAVLGRQHVSPTPWLTERHGYDPT